MVLKLNITPRQFGDAAAEAFAQGFDVTAWLYNMTCKSLEAEKSADVRANAEQEEGEKQEQASAEVKS